MPTPLPSALDVAISYSKLGWHVFPCKQDKKPLTERGFKDATVDPEQIIRWWTKWPSAQVGVACGFSDLCVIDLDLNETKNGIMAFEASAGSDPDWCELIASTPRGGRHLFYKMPRNRATCSTGPKGIDVRADGGYVIAPSPSSPGRHWRLGEPGIELTPPPAWIEKEILAAAPAPRAASKAGKASEVPLTPYQEAGIRSALAFVDSGPRETWIRMGMALKSTGAGESAYRLWDEYSRRCPGKYDPKVQRKQWDSLAEFFLDGREVALGSLFQAARDAGWAGEVVEVASGIDFDSPGFALEQVEPSVVDFAPEPDPEPLPVEVPKGMLDGDNLIVATVRWIVESAPIPQPELALGAVLAGLGAVIGRKVETPTGVRSNVYTLNVAETGCGKSHPQTAIADLLELAGMPWAVGPGTWKSDTAMRSAIEAHPSHVAIIDEFGDLLASISKKSAGGWQSGIATTLKEVSSIANSSWLPAAYADRKTNPPRPIREPNLCLIGSTLPEKLAGAITSEQVRDGLMNRCLLFVGRPRPRVGLLLDDQDVGYLEPPEDLVARWAALGAATQASKDQIEHLGRFARRLGLTQGAREARHRTRLAVQETVDQMIACHRAEVVPLYVRHDEHVLRVALIHALGRDPEATAIEVGDVEWATGLVDWCIGSLAKLVIEHVSDNENEQRWKRLLRVISEAGSDGINKTKLARRAGWCQSRERKDLLQYLTEAELIVTKNVQTRGRPEVRIVASTFARANT